MIHKNLGHFSISHNGGYSQSKTKNLATNHIDNHKQEKNMENITKGAHFN